MMQPKSLRPTITKLNLLKLIRRNLVSSAIALEKAGERVLSDHVMDQVSAIDFILSRHGVEPTQVLTQAAWPGSAFGEGTDQ